MYLEVLFGDIDPALMAAARSQTPVLSQNLAKEMVIVQPSSYFVSYFPVSVDEVCSVT